MAKLNPGEMLPQCRAVKLLFGREIGAEIGIAVCVRLGHYHCFFHERMLQQLGFDLSQLDPETPDLYLMVYAA